GEILKTVGGFASRRRMVTGEETPVDESQIFADALKRAPAERAAYLDRACAGDPGLRAGVEALLRAHAADPAFLERPAGSLGGTAGLPPGPGSPAEPPPAGATERLGAV